MFLQSGGGCFLVTGLAMGISAKVKWCCVHLIDSCRMTDGLQGTLPGNASLDNLIWVIPAFRCVDDSPWDYANVLPLFIFPHFFNINWCPSAEVLFQLLPNDDLPIASSLWQWWVGILLRGKLSFLPCVFIHVFIDTNMKSKIYLFWPVIHHDNYYLFQCSNCPRISLDEPMWASSCVLCAWPCHVWSTHFRLLLPQSWV